MVKHSDKPVSGRVWKQKKDSRFSALGDDKTAKTSFEKKMQLKKQKKNFKDIADKIKSDKAAEIALKQVRITENKTRREANEKKNEIVQKITNMKKLKKIKKKQLRTIETR